MTDWLDEPPRRDSGTGIPLLEDTVATNQIVNTRSDTPFSPDLFEDSISSGSTGGNPPAASPLAVTVRELVNQYLAEEIQTVVDSLESVVAESVVSYVSTHLLKPETNRIYGALGDATGALEKRLRDALGAERRATREMITRLHQQLRALQAATRPATGDGSANGDHIIQEQLTRAVEECVEYRLAAAVSRLESLTHSKVIEQLREEWRKVEALQALERGQLQEILQPIRGRVAELERAAAAEAITKRTHMEGVREQLDRMQGELKALRRGLAVAQRTAEAHVDKRFREQLQQWEADLHSGSGEHTGATHTRRPPRGAGAKSRNSAPDGVQLSQRKQRQGAPSRRLDRIEIMEKAYNPQAIEQAWYTRWEQTGYFAPQGGKTPYCIMIPPPNVTGSLHMGHAFQDTIMDALIRYHRMQGHNTLWQAGTDHAGIATQMVVERQLAAKGKTRHDLGREQFIKQIWRWKDESGDTITRQLRRLGASLDWSRERFTMDTGLSKAVREVFVRLYEEGLIYRGKRLVNWDPVLHTAVSDLEVISQEEQGSLWHMRYPLADGSGHVVVATTRPETMLGDAAVAVHPDDERYKNLLGKELILPLSQRRIPVIADEYVDPEFGTGCVKITPAHDFNDYQVWQRHKDTDALRAVPNNGLINIFTVDARTTDAPMGAGETGLIPLAYRGLDRFEARKRIVEDLDAQGLLEKTEPHKLMVPRGDRSHAVIEPYLTDQWYVKVGPLAEPAIKAVENGDIRFVPENWANTYFEWMRNIEDWCISRQIWWGHRIPAWYDASGNVYVGRSEAEVRRQNGLSDQVALTQDTDVLDTWFSSALWPFSTLGWPEDTPEYKTFYPTSVLVTGFDIIFFWVARMIMMGLKFTGKVPFHEVYVHGLVRDSEGQKMSKSKGNILDPLDLIDGIDTDSLVKKRTTNLMQPEMAKRIEEGTRKQFPGGIPAFGTDALRFTFAALASTGRDIRFDLNRIEGYRNFCNKLWNAARFVLMNTEDQETGTTGGGVELTLADRWITSRLQVVTRDVATHVAVYRFDLAANAIYEFTWNEYCDWYVELAKPVLSDASAPAARLRGTRRTLVRVLEALLRVAHPLIPFITEEIWQRVAPLAGVEGETIMLQPYPQANDEQVDAAAVDEMQWVQAVILGVRKIRGEMNIDPKKRLPLLVQQASALDRERFDHNRAYIDFLARLETVTWLDDEEEAPEAAPALVGEMKLLIPMAGLIDKAAETARLDKEITRMRKDLARSEAKLANPGFVQKAPDNVVAKERQKVSELRAAIRQLDEQLARIEAL